MKENKGSRFKKPIPSGLVRAIAIAVSVAVLTFTVIFITDRIEEQRIADELSRQAEISKAVEEANNKVPEIAPKKDENAENTVSGPFPGNTSGEGGSVTLEYTDQVVISKSTGIVNMHFKNPITSNQDMVIQIAIQGKNGEYIIMQSDRICPGYILRTTKAEEKILNVTPIGKYDGFYYIYYYNMNTGNRAVINTQIPIEITVTN